MVSRFSSIHNRRSSWRVAIVAAVGALAAVALVHVPGAGAAIYWTNSPPGSVNCFEPRTASIGRANLDGSLVDPTFITGADAPNGVAVDDELIYWANTGLCLNSIGAATLDGSLVDQRFVTGPSGPSGVAVDADFLYWANRAGSSSIGSSDLDGEDADESFVATGGSPCAVAVDADHIYWGLGDNGFPGTTIGRADIDGSNVTPNFITGAAAPCGIAVDSAHIYWTNTTGTSIGRADLDGAHPDQQFITGASAPCGIAVDSAHIYWGNSHAGTIGRANLDGSQVNESFIAGVASPCGVAVDAVVVTATPPSSTAPPAISGTATPGRTLTCSQGSWAGTTIKRYAFQWLRDGSDIAGATVVTYAVTATDAGHTLACQVRATNIAGSASATSAGTAIPSPPPIIAPPANTVAPAITGTPTVGQTLTCSQGSWSGSLPQSYVYQWLRDGSAIAGAATATQKLAAADGKHQLTCRVTASDGTARVDATSAAVTVASLPPMVSVDGKPHVNAKAVTLKLTCAATSSTSCKVTALLAVTEHVSRGKVVAVSAAAKRVAVGTTSASIAPGSTKTITVSLATRGRSLLAHYRTLPARLTVTLTNGATARPQVVTTATVRFRGGH